ncbi:MAG: peptidoglycan-binding domain-containing protein [Dermatophilaceae bacterium]
MPSAPRRDRRRSVRTLGALSASVIAFPLVSGSAGAGSVPVPRPTRPLPSALDVAPPYQKGTRCLTEAQPGAVAFARLLNSTYGNRTYGILRRCAAEHGEGRALDWMISAKDPKQLALADTLTRWLSAPDAQGRPGAMARRFGINYIIWNRKMWRAYAPERGWAPYIGISPHTDHIHLSFTWDGAYARTSWWTGKAVTAPLSGPTGTPALPLPLAAAPAPLLTSSGYPHLRTGASGAEVKLAQKAVGAAQDGRFGPLTATAVGRWQSAHGVRATTELDNATWARMVALRSVPSRPHTLERHARTVLRRGAGGDVVAVVQKAVGGLRVDGSYGPATEARVKAYQGSKRIAATGVVDQATWYALMGRMTPPPAPSVPAAPPRPAGSAGTPAAAHPLARYAHLTLQRHARGPAVAALQKALGRLATDGSYGPATEARVREYQTSTRLRATGVTDRAVWNALMGRSAGASGGSSAGSAGSAATSAAAASTTAFTPLKTTVLRRGAAGTAVRTLQQALGGLAVDGRFGSRTEAALAAFQRSARLPGTGVVDRRTWDALERRTHPLRPYWGTVLKRGSRGAGVQALQRALRIPADGSFGPATEAAVRSVQRQARIAQTGVVATLTWRAVEARMPR